MLYWLKIYVCADHAEAENMDVLLKETSTNEVRPLIFHWDNKKLVPCDQHTEADIVMVPETSLYVKPDLTM